MRTALGVVAAGLCTALAACATAGDAIRIGDGVGRVTRACSGGRAVDVAGDYRTVRLGGECGRVVVSGDANTVSIAAAAEISVEGRENEVTWERGLDGEAPKIFIFGVHNRVHKKK